VAFPAVSAGVYGWDAREVAETAFDAVSGFAASRPDSGVDLVEFVLFSTGMVEAFRQVREG